MCQARLDALYELNHRIFTRTLLDRLLSHYKDEETDIGMRSTKPFNVTKLISRRIGIETEAVHLQIQSIVSNTQ